jgi:hypothetical protein
MAAKHITGKRVLLTAKRLRELLDCDPEAGTLRWRERSGNPSFNAQWAGRLAGKLDPSNGYLRLMIDGRHQYVHRMVWLHVKGHLPPRDLDHKDGDKTNCAIGNLRPASKSANNSNRRRSTKQSGAPRGSWRNPRTGKFQAYIEAGGTNGVRGKRIFLGSFSTADAAERAYRDAAEDLHGAFAFVNRPDAKPAEGIAAA